MSSTIAMRRVPSPRPPVLRTNRVDLARNTYGPPTSQNNERVKIWPFLVALMMFAFILWRGFVIFPAILERYYLSAPEITKDVVDDSTSFQYLIVGIDGDPEFSRTVAFSWRLKDVNPTFSSRAFALPDQEKFLHWLSKSRSQYNIPKSFQQNVIVFKGSKFLGGSGVLRTDAHASGYKIEPVRSELEKKKVSDPPEKPKQDEGLKRNPVYETVDDSEEKHTTVAPVGKKEVKDKVEPKEQEKEAKSAVIDTVIEPLMPLEPISYLPAQITFKNKIITGYRASEDKKFSNYKPFAMALVENGWQLIYQAPLLASIILVQDQSSASVAMIKYPKAMVNNIGWGGQSCLGGTKGVQIQCRVTKAQSDGCSYESLKIQPPQSRLWIPEECSDFFDVKCKAENANEMLLIQKPSGGQHGYGMKVHKGCDKLREEYASLCHEEWPSTKKKYFVMPYLEPALLDGHKFDVRTYGLIASLDPLLVFYSDGFVRRATHKYTTDNLNDETAHITNSVRQDANDDHFWDFERLSNYLSDKHAFPDKFMSTVFRSRAMKVTEFVFQAARSGMKKKKGRFQLFAADWIVDAVGGVHLLEVNSNPLVGSPYPGLEKHFPLIWKELMDLIIKVQTGSMIQNHLLPYQFVFGGYWRLVINELKDASSSYNSCKVFAAENAKSPTIVTDASSADEKSLEQIQKSVEREEKDELLLEQDELSEHAEADEWLVDRNDSNNLLHVVSLVDLNFAAFQPDAGKKIDCLGEVIVTDFHRKCVLAEGTDDETIFHILGSDTPGPMTVVVAGVHGNEGAGVVAARHVAAHWKIQTGTLVVLERANARGISINSRFVPATADSTMYDLNRAFGSPTDESTPVKPLVKAIWSLMENIKPDLFFDLHEGRAFFASSSPSLTATPITIDQPVLQNVGSTIGNGRVSKGNSIVLSLSAEPLARVIADACNQRIEDPSKKFLIMAPPIAGGLAAKVEEAFDTKVMLFETTLVFSLESRVRQHLFMLSTALKAVSMLPPDFDYQSGGALETCVVTRKGCNVVAL